MKTITSQVISKEIKWEASYKIYRKKKKRGSLHPLSMSTAAFAKVYSLFLSFHFFLFPVTIFKKRGKKSGHAKVGGHLNFGVGKG